MRSRPGGSAYRPRPSTCVSGFNKWSGPPTPRTLVKWIAQYPGYNIAIVPGLSNLLVVDVDDPGEVPVLEDVLGATPLRTSTSRGKHLYYRKPNDQPWINLRRSGLNADLKTGNSIVIAPPSIHESGKQYTLDRCDWSALDQLPEPDIKSLKGYLKRRSGHSVSVSRRMMRDGSRKQWLNDILCGHANSCDTFEELLDVARTANESLEKRGLPLLDKNVVISRTKKVWDDAQSGLLEQWIGRQGVARSRGCEIDELSRLNPAIAPFALMLLMRLRISHAARCRRGETFQITPKAIARDGVIPGWTRERYEQARDLLLLAGLIEKVSSYRMTAGGRLGAQYRLALTNGAGAVPVTLG